MVETRAVVKLYRRCYIAKDGKEYSDSPLFYVNHFLESYDLIPIVLRDRFFV